MTNIKLSKRLKCIASMVNLNSVIADIGCDHALLDIYLSQNAIIKKALACDITKGALDSAKRNVSNSKVKNIDVRLADGLNGLTNEDLVDTVIMSGLGDQKIIKILDDNIEKLKKIDCIIIQSNTGIDKIRKNLIKLGYFIEDEKLIKERNIIYTVIKFKQGIKKYSLKQLYLGPILLNSKDQLFNDMILEKIKVNNRIISKLPKSKVLKKIKLLALNYILKKEMIKENF